MRSTRPILRLCAALLAALPISGFLAPASAQEVNFAGRTVRMIVGSTAGGVTDVGARLVARFIGKYLPQSPVIVVQNTPAANGIAAANYFYQQVAPDGATFLAGSSSQVTPDVVRTNPAVRYDPVKFVFIGGIENAGTLLIAAKPALARLKAPTGPPVIMGQVGGARTAGLIAVWGAEYLGWKLRWVTGYQGTPQLVFALQRGEADMMDTASYAVIEPLLAQGRFAAVLQTGVFAKGALTRREGFADVPLLTQMLDGKLDGATQAAFASWLRTVQIGKYYALPPNTPADYVAAYRAAFARMQDDPEFKELARKAIDPDYVMMSAADTRNLIEALVATPAQALELLNRLRHKYGLPSG
jgi:tripartite-type tricarboxylate transporter receptor subunit TctC